ncbi:MAG: hypothetical protein F6K62_21600, partial [Sphaerospermopsis sp. SIO1G2]|nr:hypothetical protein [Sphaerospermopsis sp. SIO1G2]
MNRDLLQDIFSNLFDTALSIVPDEAAELIAVKIAIIGATGVGKTTTCNVLLGTNWETSHTTATTRQLQEKRLIVNDGDKISLSP